MTIINGSPAGDGGATTEASVRTLLGVGTDVDISPFMEAASLTMEDVIAADTKGCMTDRRAEMVERYLAAHYYAMKNPVVTSKSVLGASESYQRAAAGDFIKATPYGQQAAQFDCTGFLNDFGKREATLHFLGEDEC